MQGIIYTRVSSDEQVDGTSLDHQEKTCRDYCERNGINILAVFREEGVSAKSIDRPQFLRAIDYCRKHKGQVDAFVVAKVDRFARNTEDHFAVRKLLIDYGTKLHSISEPIGDSPAEKLFETILAGFSDFDNAIRKQRCTDGMNARIKEGIYPWKPPIGYACQYANKRGQKKKEPDPPDPVTYPIIQRGLLEFATGMLSKAQFARRLDELGLCDVRGKKTSPQYVDTLLSSRRLKFYAGIIENPWTGHDVLGKHQRMIDSQDYLYITKILSGERVQPTKHHRDNAMYPLRRTVICGECRSPLTGSTSRGNGGKYAYYHCHNKACAVYGKSIPKHKLEQAFIDHLSTIIPNEKFFEAFKETVIDLWNERAGEWEHEAAGHEKKLEFLKDKRAKIFQMYEEGLYEKSEFMERKETVDNELATVKISMSEAKIEQFDIEATLNYAVNFSTNLGRLWFDLNPALRLRFQQLVFPEGLPYTRENGFGTTKLGLIFEVFEQSKGQKSSGVHLTGFDWNQIVEHLREWALLRGPLPSF